MAQKAFLKNIEILTPRNASRLALWRVPVLDDLDGPEAGGRRPLPVHEAHPGNDWGQERVENSGDKQDRNQMIS